MERVALSGTATRKDDNMFPARTKMIMTIACGIGVVAGALTYWAFHSVPQALLATGATVGGSVSLLRQFIEIDPEYSASDHETDQDESQYDVIQKRIKDPRRARR